MTTIELGKSGKTLTLRDTLTFGKFKGKTVNELLATQAGYVCWLVDQELSGEGKKKGYESFEFDTDLLIALSKRIKASSSLRSQYEHLMLEDGAVTDYESALQRREAEKEAAALAKLTAIQTQYSNIGWASW
ncbi:hypothetical protein [Cupriavidus campinensis]|uniref:Exodeoxyribonuclease X-like C-terminal domain-containing protein n=1 Tax=Cupriavidus campinensis TaxID=151783 RepID=A0ABY3ESR2_9BURK|nr:hypothetical protein [Cupriavidus campinensis]TSP14001.1 hypothetical protein FGG12_05890 [Cupriavidus campinensis]